MVDPIDRQAAIDAVSDLSVEHRVSWKDAVMDLLDELPTAEPQIIRCKNCKYQNKGENEEEAWNLCGYRPWLYTPIDDDHFCGYAERRKE